MPPGKRQQSNAMLYGLVICIFIAILAIAFAVVFYIKAEEHRTNAASLQKDLDELATATEVRNLGKLIGNKPPAKTWLALMLQYHDDSVATVTGGVAASVSAEVKAQTVKAQLDGAVALASKHIGATDPNSIGLVPVIQKLETRLQNSLDAAVALQVELDELQNKFTDAVTTQAEERDILAGEKLKLEQKVSDIQAKYDELETLMQKTADERAQTLAMQLDDLRQQVKTTGDELTKARSDLKMAQTKLGTATEKLFAVSPPPDVNAPAYKPDGKVILVDDLAKVVHLSFGSDDVVYKGLTLSVYDKGAAITRQARPKAEIEVFDIFKNHCAAKITKGSLRYPILNDDIVANLIWDRGKVNVVTVTGDFDLDRNGSIDAGAADKIKALVQKWGGKAADTVSADTDFIVIGKTPVLPKKPTFDDLELDPSAEQTYEAAVQKLKNFRDAQTLAKSLWIPIFKYETFLDFIGFNSQVTRPGAL